MNYFFFLLVGNEEKATMENDGTPQEDCIKKRLTVGFRVALNDLRKGSWKQGFAIVCLLSKSTRNFMVSCINSLLRSRVTSYTSILETGGFWDTAFSVPKPKISQANWEELVTLPGR